MERSLELNAAVEVVPAATPHPAAASSSGAATAHPGVSRVVTAASLGTAFEWYDFVLYGSLAPVLARRFFVGVDPTTAFIFALMTFAVGFMMRPLGALVFGRIGDRIGRKHTFLITVGIMGAATVGVGLLPDYAAIGMAAPVSLICLRMLQGIAVGGEYSGAMVYVAEHAPPRRRGIATSWISASSTVGLLMSFVAILVSRRIAGDGFDEWGWRLPFLFALLLLGISVALRIRMDESPQFQALRQQGRVSRAPLRETFGDPRNLRRMLVAFALCGGMAGVYFMSVMYPTFFLTQTLRMDAAMVNEIVLWVTAACTPFFVVAGWLCDRLGRKPMLMASFVLGAASIFPVFHGMSWYGNRALVEAMERAPVTLSADPRDCSFLFNPTGTRRFDTPCDIARQALAGAGVDYTMKPAAQGVTRIAIGSAMLAPYDGRGLATAERTRQAGAFDARLRDTLDAAGYPRAADATQVDVPMLVAVMAWFLCCSILSVAAMAPALVELFPTRIRFTSLSLPYNLAAGWVGGLLPTLVFAISAQAGNRYMGLWYPLGWMVMAALVLMVCYRESRGVEEAG